jgi:hypothetical protein
MTVKYEALLEPTGWCVLRDIFNWMGIEADEDFCQRAMAECALDRLRQKRNDLKSRGLASVDGADFFRKGKADSWAGELSRRELEAIEYIAGDLMHKCGYTTSTKLAASHRKPWHIKSQELLNSLEWRANRAVSLTFDKLRRFV